MSDTISIVPFTPQYQDQVLALIVSIQQEEYHIAITPHDQPDLHVIQEYYQRGAGNFWVALVNNSVIGTIALRDIGNGHVALRKMFVARPYRGSLHGTAQLLLTAAVRWAHKNGIRSVFLGTTAQFHAAHRFYEKHGFTEIARELLPPAFPVMTVDTKFYKLFLDGPSAGTERGMVAVRKVH